jgi:hypothetical protein
MSPFIRRNAVDFSLSAAVLITGVYSNTEAVLFSDGKFYLSGVGCFPVFIELLFISYLLFIKMSV